MMRGRLFFAIAFAAAAGCSLLVDTTDLQRGAPPDAGDAAPIDAAVDSTTTEDSGPIDAGPTCDATFCDDFEQAPLGAKWDVTSIDGGGSLSLDGTSPHGGLFALRAVLPDNPGQDSFGELRKDFGTVHLVDCTFAMRLASASTKPFTEILHVEADSTGSVQGYSFLFAIGIQDGVSSIREDVSYSDGGCGCPRTYQSMPTPTFGTWTKVRVRADFATAEVYFDDALVASGAYGGDVVPSNVQLFFGGRAHDTAMDLQLDDLVCSVAP